MKQTQNALPKTQQANIGSFIKSAFVNLVTVSIFMSLASLAACSAGAKKASTTATTVDPGTGTAGTTNGTNNGANQGVSNGFSFGGFNQGTGQFSGGGVTLPVFLNSSSQWQQRCTALNNLLVPYLSQYNNDKGALMLVWNNAVRTAKPTAMNGFNQAALISAFMQAIQAGTIPPGTGVMAYLGGVLDANNLVKEAPAGPANVTVGGAAASALNDSDVLQACEIGCFKDDAAIGLNSQPGAPLVDGMPYENRSLMTMKDASDRIKVGQKVYTTALSSDSLPGAFKYEEVEIDKIIDDAKEVYQPVYSIIDEDSLGDHKTELTAPHAVMVHREGLGDFQIDIEKLHLGLLNKSIGERVFMYDEKGEKHLIKSVSREEKSFRAVNFTARESKKATGWVAVGGKRITGNRKQAMSGGMETFIHLTNSAGLYGLAGEAGK